MPLLDHFHPPLHGPRRWEGFHHAWATSIAYQLNELLPAEYFAESEISLGPELEVDVATMEDTKVGGTAVVAAKRATAVWTSPRPRFAVRVDYSHLDTYARPPQWLLGPVSGHGAGEPTELEQGISENRARQ